MKKIVFTIASRRLEVDLEDEFADYLLNDLEKNNLSLDEDHPRGKLLELYLKSLHKAFSSEEYIETLLNQNEASNW